MDWETERQNQTSEQYPKTFYNDEHDNSVELLLGAEFAYHNTIHPSSMITPVWAIYQYHQVMQFRAQKQPSSLTLAIEADTFSAGLEETNQTLSENLQ